MKTAGTIENNELWLRCPFCGDSKSSPEKSHFAINLRKYVYHCYRCNEGGKLTAKQLLSILSSVGETFWAISSVPFTERDRQDEAAWPELIPGPGNRRKSELARYHVIDEKDRTWDAFIIREPRDNTVCGLHLRWKNHRLGFGDRGYSWPGDEGLISSPRSPIRIVEGPYDVVTQFDASGMGVISRGSLRPLKGHFVILCPDGDIWTQNDLLFAFLKTMRAVLLDTNHYPYVVGLEYLPAARDPDEVPVEQRTFIPHDEIPSFLDERVKSFLAK